MWNLGRTLKRLLLAVCAVVPCACSPQGTATPVPRRVLQVNYVESSGPLPDQWAERYLISYQGLRFQRIGAEGGPINVGVWELQGDRDALDRLFAALAAVDCSSIQEIPPDELLDGGGSTTYDVAYADGSLCGAWYREGYTYKGAGPLIEPVDEFIGGLSLPAEAVERFREP